MTNPVTTIFHRSPIQQEISLQVVEAALSDPLFEWAGEGELQASSERVTTDIRRELLQLGSIPGQCGNFFGPGGHPLFAVRFALSPAAGNGSTPLVIRDLVMHSAVWEMAALVGPGLQVVSAEEQTVDDAVTVME